MFDWILGRLREPSTYAGLSGLALTFGLSADQWQTVSVAIAAVAGVVAMFLHESKPAA